MTNNEIITLDHGSGGELTSQLIHNLFLRYFKDVQATTDSALIELTGPNIAFTTDSFVVNPILFPGGNIGKLSICGTVNDLAVSGATPKLISCGFILEEGLSYSVLEEVVCSMADEAISAGVKIVTGDTKVVEHGACDQIFINTSGIGTLDSLPQSNPQITPGDLIIINGTIAEHGLAVMGRRNNLNFDTPILSDCASLNNIIASLRSTTPVHFMRDATRGGVATVLNELASDNNIGISIDEHSLPISEEVKGLCEILGFDPLYVANEGKFITVIPEKNGKKVMEILTAHPLGKKASIIGIVTKDNPKKVSLNTAVGGKRIIHTIVGNQLPRIC